MTIEVNGRRAKEIKVVEEGFGWNNLAIYQEKDGKLWLARDRSDLDTVRFDVREAASLDDIDCSAPWTAEVTFDKEWHWNER